MIERNCKEIARRWCIAALFLLALVGSVKGQSPTGILRGQVTDPSGAGIVGATILATNSAGDAKGATTAKDGSFEFKDLPPGVYRYRRQRPDLHCIQSQACPWWRDRPSAQTCR